MPADAKLNSIPQSAKRWIRFGPYYGMFPVEFAVEIIDRYSQPGDWILDPFCGRGTSVAAAVAQGRRGLGIEINPVGWLYGRVKLAPAPLELVLQRLEEIGDTAQDNVGAKRCLPEFYRWCFTARVRRFLLAARHQLDWRNDLIDTTLMAFILGYLHSKRGQALSNQMRQQKSMAPDYSVRWWRKRGMRPPKIDPVAFLAERVRWRYACGTLKPRMGQVLLGDSRELLPDLVARHRGRYRLLLTSPPYHDITNYYYDHWLRYWMLGGPELPTSKGERWRSESRQHSRERYRDLLAEVFRAAAGWLHPNATVYVRTDAREFTRRATEEVLLETFPKKHLSIIPKPFSRPTQTSLFGDFKLKPGEVDIVLT
jgi:hypothetical protein